MFQTANDNDLCQWHFVFVMDTEVAKIAVEAFRDKKCDFILPSCSFLLPELKELQSVRSNESFAELFEQIDPNWSVREAAQVLGRCKRLEQENSVELYLESLKLFSAFEARIRFSLWPQGTGAPHHFSKLLYTRKARSTLSDREILAILAVFADPKGLNLRNVVLHGFEVDTSLSIPLLRGLYERIIPKLPEPVPPEVTFERELRLLEFSRERLGITMERQCPVGSRFPMLDEFRREIMKKSYELIAQENFFDAALMLLPLLEQSLRRATVATLNLSLDRLCASSEEHFVALKESCDVLPVSLQNMVTDLLFAPDGPRLRDNLMHGNTTAIPREFVHCLFSLFEQCAAFFDEGETSFSWNWAFHPARCLEYELSRYVRVPNLDLIPKYDSQTYERLIECVVSLKSYDNVHFRDGDDWSIMDGRFQRFICACTIAFAAQPAKNSAIQQLVGLSYAPIKFGPKNDVERFQRTVVERVKTMKTYLPFCDSGQDYTYDRIRDLLDDEKLVHVSLEFAMR